MSRTVFAAFGRRLFPGLDGRLNVIERALTVGIPNLLHKMEAAMAAREDAAYDKLNATIATVKDGWGSLVAERDRYKAALEAADANQAAAVAAALEADSDVDAGKVEAADAALAELVPAPSSEPDVPVEESPAGPSDEAPAQS
jgi:hypothetical protein